MTYTPEVLAHTILAVRAGRLSATAAAKQLGISRKTYYQKEARLLTGGLQALQPGRPGRPAQARDPEKERLAAENQRLREQVQRLEQRLHIRTVLTQSDTRAKKK